MTKYKTKGLFNGIIASVSYGTNPLFALPMYNLGMGVNSVLFYRYFFAVIIYGIWLKYVKKISFRITVKEFFALFLLAILFALSSVTLFESFKYIPSGIACTLLFIYPALVAVISTVFFKEKFTKTMLFSMLIALSGVFILNGGIHGHLNKTGITYVFLSALVYAIYIVLVKNFAPIKHIKYDKLSFYVMLLGLCVFIWNLKFCTILEPLNNWKLVFCSLGLALFPTIISLETVNIAIKLVGSTTTAILGVLEPLTALFIGTVFFNEVLNFYKILGIILIFSGISLIILHDKLKGIINERKS